MTTSEKVSLTWNDFKLNIINSFGSLRDESEFTDVTLACEDGQQVDAHKVILSASSPFFQNLLRRNKYRHPLIYMRGMKSEDLFSIMDFLYYGEANIYEENLNNFLGIAKELQLKGLKENHVSSDLTNHPENGSNLNAFTDKTLSIHQDGKGLNKSVVSEKYFKGEDESKKAENVNNTDQAFPEIDDDLTKPMNLIFRREENLSQMPVAKISPNYSEDLKDLDEKIKSMMSLGQTLVKGGKQKNNACPVCGKEGGYGQIMGHIEANHLEGVSIPCNQCDKNFRTRSAYKWHNANKHGFK